MTRRHRPVSPRDWEARYPTLVVAGRTIIDVRSGWYAVVHDALWKLAAIADEDTRDALPDLRVLEIAQKYGTLRIDTNRTSVVIESVIERAEARSEVTCEFCGRRGRLRDSGGWLTTLCNACAKARRAR